ncbi:MAG: spore germination protein [Clostridia bacterium]|nr:spore germination protein [Clostridia bacterium]
MKAKTTTNISVRQICFIMLAYTVVGKLLTYPTALSFFCERDLLFPALIDFLIEGIIIWGVAFLCSRTDKTFFELLKGTIGNIGARIVFGFFAVLFLLAALVPLFEQELYVHTIFYDTVPPLAIFVPFFIFAIYAGGKRFQNIGRCADLCMPIFVITMLVIFIMSCGEAKWDNLLPVLKTPAKDIFGAAAGNIFRFVEPCWMLMFMGRFKYKKGDAAKITVSYAAGAVIVIFFLATFYAIYGGLAPSRTYAISRTSLYFSAIDTIGRIDLIMLYVLETVMLFGLVLNIQLAVYAISECSGWERSGVISLFVNIALAAVLIACDGFYNSVYNLYNQWLWIYFLIFTVLIPVLAWTLKRRQR